MDFNNLKKETQMNPTGPKGSSYRVKWNKKDHKFTLAPLLMTEMGLIDNSLLQLNDDDTKQIFFAVMPADTGVFFKNKPGQAKGVTRKNSVFHNQLVKYGYKSEELDFLLQEGKYDGNPVWKVVEVGEESEEEKEAMEATESPSPDPEEVISGDTDPESESPLQDAGLDTELNEQDF